VRRLSLMSRRDCKWTIRIHVVSVSHSPSDCEAPVTLIGAKGQCIKWEHLEAFVSVCCICCIIHIRVRSSCPNAGDIELIASLTIPLSIHA